MGASRHSLPEFASMSRYSWEEVAMPATDPRKPTRHDVSRRTFLKRAGWTGAGMTALVVGADRGRASGQTTAATYPEWIPASTKPAKRGGVLTRASAWDPPLIDPRLTQSVGLYQFAGLTSNRLVRYVFSDEASGPSDMSLKGDLAESWQSDTAHRVWTFKLRQGVKWQNLAPLNGRELTAADVKYCFEAYAKEGVQTFTFQEIEGMETPDKHTLRVHLKPPNTLFAQNLAEPIAVIFAREVLEEDGDLKKRLIGTGPYILKEHTRKVRVVLQRNPDYFDKGRPNIDEYVILSAPDDATRVAAFRTGQSDVIWRASRSDVEVIRKTNPAAVVQSYHNTLAPFGLALAQDRPPFNDVRVRRAISMAIDRQKQVDTVYEGHGIPGWGVPYIYYQDKAPTAAQLGPWWQYKPPKSPKNFFRVNDPQIDELTVKLRQTPDPAERRTITKKIVDREFDQAYRLWMPYDNGFVLFQPHVRNGASRALRRTDGYGS